MCINCFENKVLSNWGHIVHAGQYKTRQLFGN